MVRPLTPAVFHGLCPQDMELMVFGMEPRDWRPVEFEKMKTGVTRFATRCFSELARALPTKNTACSVLEASVEFNSPGENRITLIDEALANLASAHILMVPEKRLDEKPPCFF